MQDKVTPMGTMGTGTGASADQAPAKNVATEDIAINAKGEKVSASSPDAVTLIAAKGQPIPSDEHIRSMGFKSQAQRDADAGTPKADGDAPAEKAADKAEDKASGKAEDKAKAKSKSKSK